MLKAHIELCVTEPDFLGKVFCAKNWESEPKMGQKQSFLNVLKNCVINFY